MLKATLSLILGQFKRIPRALVGLVFTYAVCAAVAHLLAHDTTLQIRENIISGDNDYRGALFFNLLSLKGLYPLICVLVVAFMYLMFRAERSSSMGTGLVNNPLAIVRDVGLIYILAFAAMTSYGQARYREPLFEGYFLAGIAFTFLVVIIVTTGGSARDTPKNMLISMLWLFFFVTLGQLLPNVITGEATFNGAFYILVDAGIVYVFASFGALLTSKGAGTLISGKDGKDPTPLKLAGASFTIWFAGVMMSIAAYLIGLLFLFVAAIVLAIVVGVGLLIGAFTNFERAYGKIFEQIAPLQEQEGEGWLELLSPFTFIAGYIESIVLEALRGNPTELLTLLFIFWATAELIREFDMLYGENDIDPKRKGLTAALKKLKGELDDTQTHISDTQKHIDALYEKWGLDPEEEAATFAELERVSKLQNGELQDDATATDDKSNPFGRKEKPKDDAE